MPLRPQCILGVALVSSFASFMTTISVLAGPADYVVERTVVQDGSLCEDGAATVTLQGSGLGDDGELLTVIETINVGVNFDGAEITDISNPGMLQDVLPPSPGMFDGRLLVEIPSEPYADGEGSLADTIHNSGDSYTSISNTGHDIWISGDAMEFAYTQLDGDFDVSVKIDNYTHSTNVGCWGKYGIMARQTLEHHSRMVSIQNHGPQGQPGGTPGPDPGECIDAPSQSTSILTRRAHRDTDRATAGFIEAIYLEPESGNGFAKPTEYNNFDYLRLTRRGDLFEGWVTNDSDVETEPTNDARWEKLEIGPWDGGDYLIDPPGESISCWYVGFGNSEGPNGGVDIQTVDFSVVNWTAVGGSCYEPQASEKTITWTNVTRAEVTAGLNYSINLTPGNERFSPVLTGRVDDGGTRDVMGPGAVELFDVESIGTLSMRGLGGGFGTGAVDGSVFEMTGGGQDIWNNGDDLNFMYQKVTGDFDVTAFVVNLDLELGGPFAKYGLMSRQTCHFDSRADFMATRTRSGPVGGARFAHRGPHRDPGGWSEGYQVDLESVPVPGEVDPLNPDFFRLIRTGSQITGYVAWEDPNNLGEPFHWCIVGSRNSQARSEDHFVGMAMNSNSVTIANTVDFTLDIQPYAPTPLGDLDPGALVFERNFNSDANNTPPLNGFWGSRDSNGAAAGFDPVVLNGKLRITDEAVADAATAVWFADDALDNILETGFIAEYDVHINRDGLPDPDPVPGTTPGEGGMFVVVASGSDQFGSGECLGTAGTTLESFPDETLGIIVGTDAGGLSQTQVNRGDAGTPADDVYTNFSSTGGEIWNCDDMSYDYTQVSGDFDLAIEITFQDHESGLGQWGKQGIMARETLSEDARFVMVHDTLPFDDGTMVTARRSAVDCGVGTMSEFSFTPEDRFLRLTRRGETLQGFASDEPGLGDGSLNPQNDCNWTPGPAVTLSGLANDLFLGVANGEDFRDGIVIQTMRYRILGPNPGGAVNTETAFRTEFVGYPNEMGFGGAAGGGDPTRGPAAHYECHPMFAVEVDTRTTPNIDNEGVGAPDNTGLYHIGLNVGAITHSRQTNDQFGVDAEELPDVFGDGLHMKVEYRPNGEVRVDVSPVGGGGEVRVIDTYIPPLNIGSGLADPIIGFIGSTTFGDTQTLEFDNLTITALGAGDPLGACCTEGNCDIQTQANCEAGGGIYQGDGLTCDSIECIADTIFRRGDHDGSGIVDITDPLNLLGFLFLGTTPPICEDASDGDNSAALDISDALNLLGFLFLGSFPLNETLPGPMNCGQDPDVPIDPDGPGGFPEQPAQSLGCDMYPSAVGTACP